MEKLIITTLISLTFLSCGVQDTKQMEASSTDTIVTTVSPQTHVRESMPDTSSTDTSRTYKNKRFRNVRVQNLGNDSFQITGQGQIFEASFNWVIEDGHEELQHSYSTTDAGAPEWGSFSFKVHAPKKQPNSTLHLVLFETSAMDGSRQHELPLLLH